MLNIADRLMLWVILSCEEDCEELSAKCYFRTLEAFYMTTQMWTLFQGRLSTFLKAGKYSSLIVSAGHMI
jgi:hypothetical protein